ncbi:putative E3 ubiquitin-protein ligase TRIML1 isoform X2 [Brachyhypopomus gauderio]|uniref:putative E3 ubiquitin-protein ligase TRIML1 isoform X2 n=1 Tax=Brachyhypopomus gauderio TaxID=698409 RepID=UPI004042C198
MAQHECFPGRGVSRCHDRHHTFQRWHLSGAIYRPESFTGAVETRRGHVSGTLTLRASAVMMAPCEETPIKQQGNLKKHLNILAYRMKKLSAKKMDLRKKTAALKETIKTKYDDIKRVLDEDLRITLGQLDMEEEAMERNIDENIKSCYHLSQDLDQQLTEISIQLDKQVNYDQVSETEERIMETLKSTDPELVQMDEFKNEQLLSLTMNLLLFIRSQVPITKKLFQTYAQKVVLNPDSAHPKLIISPAGDSATYTDTWQEVSENPSRFDTTLNVISQEGFKEGRNYWEVQVSGKTYWELGLTYPSIPRKGNEEDCWLGRGPESWCVEFFNGDYTAWHNGVPHGLSHVSGRSFERIGVFTSFYRGLVCFLGADTMTPLYSFCAGMFTDELHLAICPGHDNHGTNRRSLRICDASRSAPVL